MRLWGFPSGIRRHRGHWGISMAKPDTPDSVGGAESADDIRNKHTALLRRLGEHVAPAGTYVSKKMLPFAGEGSCSVQRLEAGCWTELLIDYRVGAAGLADGAWLKLAFKFYSDW